MYKLQRLRWMLCLFVTVNTSWKTKTPKYINNYNYIMNIYYYFLNLNQTSISKLLFFLFFFLYSLSLILSLNMFILFLPYLNTLCFSGNWNSVFGPRNRWIWSCRSNTTSQLQLFANTNIFCLNFLQFRFFTWKRRKEILRSLSQVRPKEFTYFFKNNFWHRNRTSATDNTFKKSAQKLRLD